MVPLLLCQQFVLSECLASTSHTVGWRMKQYMLHMLSSVAYKFFGMDMPFSQDDLMDVKNSTCVRSSSTLASILVQVRLKA
jgi:hypothetical protein